jgi:hypothetical protein
MAHIERISRSENGYVESFNGRRCDVLLSGEIFATLREAQIVIEDGASTAIACGRTHRWATGRQLCARPAKRRVAAERNMAASPLDVVCSQAPYLAALVPTKIGAPAADSAVNPPPA